MRYSDLDLVGSIGVMTNSTMEHSECYANDLDVNCNEDNISDILDNCSISEEECRAERNDNNNKNNKIGSRSKPKKRVMFKCGDNLVMIREIPPRESSPDSVTTEDSCSETESETTESESEESDQNCNNKTELKPVRKINPRVARIIREAPIEIKQKDPPLRRPTKKRLARKNRKENATKESTQIKTVEKISLKPKQIQLKAPEKEIPKVSEPSKHSKTNIKRKKVPANRLDSPLPKGNIDCKNSKIILTERLKRKPTKTILEKREKQIESPKILNSSEHYAEQCVISELSQSDDRPLSQSDKRLYSWLLANGRIPGPEQQSPCISPMWDTKQGFVFDITNNSIVKAPT